MKGIASLYKRFEFAWLQFQLKIKSITNGGQNRKSNFYYGLIVINILALGFIFGFLNPGELHTDGGTFAAIAFKDINGGKLYLDTWDNKPPGIYYLIEIFFKIIPSEVYALYCLSITGILTLVNGLYFTSFYLLKSLLLSILVITSFILISVNGYFMDDGLYTEIYGSSFIIWSLFYYHQFCRSNKVRHAFISAFLAGVAFWFKEPFIFLSIPIVIFLGLKLRLWKQLLKVIFFMMLPSSLFILILLMVGSLNGFFDLIFYNLGFAGSKSVFITTNQLQILWGSVLRPLLIVWSIVVVYGLFSVTKKELRTQVIFSLILLAGGLLFIFISPDSFIHYYLPFTVILFYCLSVFLSFENLHYKGSRVILYILMLYNANKLDNEYSRRFKTSFALYMPDRIAETLKNDKSATLFVDHVSASEYYIKGEKKFTTFIPVPFFNHLSGSAQGMINRQRIYDELRGHKPDYIIANESGSEMANCFPDLSFFSANYEKRDSIMKFGNRLFLWKLRQVVE